MVVKIQNSCKTMGGVLDYNERKVEEGCACVIHTNGILAPDRLSVREAFAVYERRNIRTENVSFHMSINPGPGDSLTEHDIVEFAGKMMAGLGYADQPYVIYRHDDIDRPHYHVVSIRVNEHGRKIKDTYEHVRCQELMRELQNEYNFVIGSPEIPGEPEIPGPVYERGAADVTGQLLNAFTDSMEYHFTTWPQFQKILAAHAVNAEITGPDDSLSMTLQGMSQDGTLCTAIFSEGVLGKPLHDMFAARMRECTGHGDMRTEKNRIRHAVRVCTATAIGEEHLKDLLSRRGIDLVLSRGRDGSVFGVTLIDHKTKSAFKGSELGKEIGVLIRDTLNRTGLPDTGVVVVPDGVGQHPDDFGSGDISVGIGRSEDAGIDRGISSALLFVAELLEPERFRRQKLDKKKKHKKRRR